MATKTELRMLLPGSGDLKEIIDGILDKRSASKTAGDLDLMYEVTQDEAKEILDAIIEWAAEDTDAQS